MFQIEEPEVHIRSAMLQSTQKVENETQNMYHLTERQQCRFDFGRWYIHCMLRTSCI